MKTKGDIINLLGDGTVQFDETNYPMLCDDDNGNGEWHNVVEVTPYGLRMDDGDIWDYDDLSQGEINLIYEATRDLITEIISTFK